MIRALFRKQLMEVFAWLYRERKSGRNRTRRGLVLYGLLYLCIFGLLGTLFYGAARMLCVPLASAGLGWLFFALMGLVAVALGVFGSVFSTYTSLYQARDNDLLLSMPVPPRLILAARLSGVYLMGLLYELVVMVPAVIVYLCSVPVGPLGVLFTLLIPLVLSLLVLTLSCVLGWVVALVSGRLRHKNIVTVLLSLAFIAVYYFCYAKAYSMLQVILSDPQPVGEKVRLFLYPLYHMGLAAGGSAVSMLIFTAILAGLFLAVYLVLSRSFVGLATRKRGGKKTRRAELTTRAGSVRGALLRKELRRFLGSATYMLNCGLGIVIMPAAGVALLLKGGTLLEILSAVLGEREGLWSLLAAGAICMVTCMNNISAPSVSLEGKELWLVRSLPVSGRQVLAAKLQLHLLLSLGPALFLTVCAEVVLRPSPVFALLLPAAAVVYTLLIGLLGLCLNLRMPNLNWTSETVPVKQSAGVLFTLFGGWAAVAALAGLYWLLMDLISPAVYLLAAVLAILAADLLLLAWLRGAGARRFEAL